MFLYKTIEAVTDHGIFFCKIMYYGTFSRNYIDTDPTFTKKTLRKLKIRYMDKFC